MESFLSTFFFLFLFLGAKKNKIYVLLIAWQGGKLTDSYNAV